MLVLYADGALGIALLVLWVYSLFDVITSDVSQIRNLPQWAWVVIVLVLGELGVGPVLWFLAGRPRRTTGPEQRRDRTRLPPEYDRPGRAVASSPDDDAAFLAGLQRRAAEQRRAAAEPDRSTEQTPEPDGS